jgi:hypothetical protein
MSCQLPATCVLCSVKCSKLWIQLFQFEHNIHRNQTAHSSYTVLYYIFLTDTNSLNLHFLLTNCHHYQISNCYCTNTNVVVFIGTYLICQLWLLIYLMTLFLTPHFMTENINVNSQKYQWNSTVTLNLCAQIKYFHNNIGHAVQLLSMQWTEMKFVARIRNTLFLQ